MNKRVIVVVIEDNKDEDVKKDAEKKTELPFWFIISGAIVLALVLSR